MEGGRYGNRPPSVYLLGMRWLGGSASHLRCSVRLRVRRVTQRTHLRDVQTCELRLGRNSHAEQRVVHLEEDERHTERPDERHGRTDELSHELAYVTVEQAF